MDKEDAISLEQISGADREQTPARVKRLVQELMRRLEWLEAQQEGLRQENQLLRAENEQLKAENQRLQEAVKRNSRNSSQPPSQDGPKGFKDVVQGKER